MVPKGWFGDSHAQRKLGKGISWQDLPTEYIYIYIFIYYIYIYLVYTKCQRKEKRLRGGDKLFAFPGLFNREHSVTIVLLCFSG